MSNVWLQEPSPEVVACINNGEDEECTQDEEREAGLGGQWQEGGGDLSSLDSFLASGWGTD